MEAIRQEWLGPSQTSFGGGTSTSTHWFRSSDPSAAVMPTTCGTPMTLASQHRKRGRATDPATHGLAVGSRLTSEPHKAIRASVASPAAAMTTAAAAAAAASAMTSSSVPVTETDSWSSFFTEPYTNEVIQRQPFWRKILVWNCVHVLDDALELVVEEVQSCAGVANIRIEFLNTLLKLLQRGREFQELKIFIILVAITSVPTVREMVRKMNGDDEAVSAVVDKYTDLLSEQNGYMRKFWHAEIDPLREVGHVPDPEHDDFTPCRTRLRQEPIQELAAWYFSRYPIPTATETAKASIELLAKESVARERAVEALRKEIGDGELSAEQKIAVEKEVKLATIPKTKEEMVMWLHRHVNLSTIKSIIRSAPSPRLPHKLSTTTVKVRGGKDDTMFNSIAMFVSSLRNHILMMIEGSEVPLPV